MPKRAHPDDAGADGSDGSRSSAKKAVRTPQACCNCRRRKSKCDGCRPCCHNCSRLHDTCKWPPMPFEPPEVSTLTRTRRTPQPTGFLPVVSINGFPQPAKVQRLLDLFYQLHHDVEFCSFIHRHSFDLRQPQSPFLIASIIALSALYVSDDEAQQDFGFGTAAELSQYYLSKARGLSRDLSQSPCVLNIQSNLILAICEHLSWNETRAFMSAGLAIRMAQTMRLGREYNQSHSIREQEIRRRTFWACYIMDRLICFTGSRAPTISLIYTDLNLPCPETIFAFEDPYTGPKIKDILSTKEKSTQHGILPFFITTMTLWANMIDYYLSVGRESKFAPTDPNGEFYKAARALQDWAGSLPLKMSWSEANYKLHRSLGQGKAFVTLHFLLRHGMAIGHSDYLPQLDTPTDPLDSFDGAGLSMFHHDDVLISVCLNNTQAIVEMAKFLHNGTDQDRENLRSTAAAHALLLSATVLLWTHYVGNSQSDVENGNILAKSQYDLIISILTSWRSMWAIVQPWLETLEMISTLYESAYSGQPGANLLFDNADIDEGRAIEPTDPSSRSQLAIETSYNASIGNGIGDPTHARQRMSDKIRLSLLMAMVSSRNKDRLKQGFLSTLWQHISYSDVFASPGDAFAGVQTTPVMFTDFLAE